MLLIAWIIGAVFGIGIGGLIATKLKSKCIHTWQLIESGKIWRGKEKNVSGWIKVYQCEHCKKMKKEQIEID